VKTLGFALIASLALGCPSRESVTSTDTITTSGTVATGTVSKTSTGSTGGTASTLSAQDKEFFIAAAQKNSAEIVLSRAAVEQATNGSVQNLANHLLSDHNNFDRDLQDLALKKGVALPAEPAVRTPDVDFVQQVIRDHERMIADFSSATIADPDLRAWAAKALPILRDHVAQAKKISGS
jgi:putative membrane protein